MTKHDLLSVTRCGRRPLMVFLFLTAVLIGLVASAPPSSAIIDGTVVTGGWYADPRPNPNPYAFVGRWETADGVCTASLVAPDLVLTAAHCAAYARVRFNVLNRDRDLAPGSTAVETRNVIDYRYQNDAPGLSIFGNTLIARLDRPVLNIAPVHMPDPKADKALWAGGAKLDVLGWGVIDGNTLSAELRKATEKVVDNNVVSPPYTGLMRLSSVSGRADHGDSGGPAVARNARGDLVLVGIVEAGVPLTSWSVFNRIWPQKALVSFINNAQYVATPQPQPTPPPPLPGTTATVPPTPQAVPAAPTLSTTGKTTTSASLSWSRPSGASSYTVYDGTTAVATTTDPTVTEKITGLAPATTHQFTVKAKNSAGESLASNVVTVKTLDSYTYSFVSQSASGDLAHARPGQEFTITLKVKNTGTATWSPTGSSPVLLGTTRPNDHSSAMQASGWVTSTRLARLQESSVAKGQTGTFVFPVKTPEKAGSLTEYFTLVAENTSWFNDAGVNVTITTIPIVATAARPGTNGQWNVASDGGVFAENGAPFFGSKGGQALNAPIVGVAATKSGNGYWLVGADGGVFAYGDAGFAGSLAGQALNRPIVGIAGTPTGQGYWLVGGDGGVFAYGDAQFYGSMGGKPLNAAIVGIASTPSGRGYWLAGSDGGVFAYGDAQFAGSMVDKTLNKPITGIASDGSRGGYFLVGGDGGIYAFGSAHFLGSAGGGGTARTTVGMTLRAAGYLTIDSAGTSLFYDGTASTPAPPPPPPPAEPTTLYANQTLGVGSRLVSGNGQYVLVMQGDGNLVEYASGNRPVWASGTGVPGTVLINQSDGNLVLVAPDGRPVWATGTNGNPDSVFIVQNDANLVVYAPGNRPIWASGTRP